MNFLVIIEATPPPQPGEQHDRRAAPVGPTPWRQLILQDGVRELARQLVVVVREGQEEAKLASECVRLHRSEAIVLRAPASVRGSACAALLAAEYVDDRELCLVEGCQCPSVDLAKFVAAMRGADVDAGVGVCESPQFGRPNVRLDGAGLVEEAMESRVDGPQTLAGIYYYRSGSDFLKSAEAMISKSRARTSDFTLAPCLNELILLGKRIGAVPISQLDSSTLSSASAA